jgi:prophage regulatory protein
VREVRTIDGWVDADYEPERRPAHRLPSADVAAAHLKIAEFVFDYEARWGCVRDAAIKEAEHEFSCTPKHVKACLREHRLGQVIETTTWVGPSGSRPRHLVSGADGRWRDVPNARIRAIADQANKLAPTSGDSEFVAGQGGAVISSKSQVVSGGEKMQQAVAEPVILRVSEVIKRGYATSRTSLWRAVKAGRFPAPVQLGPHAIGYRKAELDAWLAELPSAAT